MEARREKARGKSPGRDGNRRAVYARGGSVGLVVWVQKECCKAGLYICVEKV